MARKSDFIYLQGKSKWAKLTTPNKFGKWSIDVYLDEASLAKFKELKEKGIKNSIKKDDDGYYVSLQRPQTKTSMRGFTFGYSAPIVLDKDGETPFTGSIGNNSDVTAKIEVYYYDDPFGKEGSAIRLASVRVDHLVEFEGDRDYDKDQTRQVKGMNEYPQQKAEPF